MEPPQFNPTLYSVQRIIMLIQVGMEPPNPTLYSVQRIQVGMEPPNSIPPYILYKGSLC